MAGKERADAYRGIFWLGFARFPTRGGPPKREVIHLACGRRFWTNHPAVPGLHLYSLRAHAVVPKGTRLATL